MAVLSAVESARVYKLRKNPAGLVTPVKQAGKCVHYYHYFLHPELGLCYVRVQSWFPFQVRIGLNGRQWLYRQLEGRGVPFESRDNLLSGRGRARPAGRVASAVGPAGGR